MLPLEEIEAKGIRHDGDSTFDERLPLNAKAAAEGPTLEAWQKLASVGAPATPRRAVTASPTDGAV